jgi:hypothetical protein
MPVRAIRLVMMVTLSAGLLLVSCQDETEIKQMNCHLLTAALEFTEDSIQVMYRFEAKGDCEPESFFYYTDSQKVTINNPDTLAEVYTTLSTQKWIQAGAVGTTMNGSIKVSFKAVALSKTYEAMDQCQQNIVTE